nr:hypothetical protein [Fodinicola feengrottensis]
MPIDQVATIMLPPWSGDQTIWPYWNVWVRPLRPGVSCSASVAQPSGLPSPPSAYHLLPIKPYGVMPQDAEALEAVTDSSVPPRGQEPGTRA